MYNRFQQFIAVAMAMLVFISTLSVSIEKHYCGDNLVDFAFFAEAEKCGSEASDKGLATSDEGPMLMAKSCCKDVVDLHQGQDELSLEKTKVLTAAQKVFVASFAYVFGGLYDQKPENDTLFKHYIPPRFVRDIHVRNSVFLI
jgi:hypothetical protein